jgi:isocitrate dehydrogenase
MVNSDKGITNLHVPSDVIVDASMPAMIRDSGGMWGADGKLQDTKAVIPDRCYAGVYQAVIEDCKRTARSTRHHGQRAERGPDGAGGRGVRFARQDLPDPRRRRGARHRRSRQRAARAAVEPATSGACARPRTRRCRTGSSSRSTARATGAPAVFWLDPVRAHDAQIIAKVERYLKDHDTSGLDIRIMTPVDATRSRSSASARARTRSR